MKPLSLLFPLIILFSCAKNEDYLTRTSDSHSLNPVETVSFLVFDSDESLAKEIAKPSNEVETRSTVEGTFKSLFTPLKNYDYDKDPILSYELSLISEEEFDSEKSVYRLLGYNELVPNEDFARLLNIRGEFCVGDTMYKVSPRGTYYFPVSLRDVFETNYSSYESSEGILSSENTYKIDSLVYRYDTFHSGRIEEETHLCMSSSYENSVMTRSDPLPSFNWSNYPTYSGPADDYLDDQIFTYSLPSNRRIKTRVYYHNYVAYKERGAYVKCQRKVTLGWSDVTSVCLLLRWRNIIMQGSHRPNEPVPPTGTYMGYETETVTYENASETMINIRGYVLPSNQLDNVVRGGASTLRTIIQNAIGVDINGCRIVRLVGHDYVQIFWLGTWSNVDTNVEEVKVKFTKDWLSGIPHFIGGQFMYGALDDNSNFGALRVGSAF